jgi:hypothetical protein
MSDFIDDPSDEELKRTVFPSSPYASTSSSGGHMNTRNEMGRAAAAREYTSLEHAVYRDETEEMMARRIFRQALPGSAAGIVDIAMNSTNDRTRLDACKYIVERNLGKVGDDAAFAGDNALAAFVNGIEDELKKGSK